MIANVKAVALLGAAVASLGLSNITGTGIADAQPSPRPAVFTCPGDGGTEYLPDPDDSNAFYTCTNGQQVNHDQCPSVTKLTLGKKPECLSNPDDDKP